jgi:Sec-independent protein translocase protein TatA
VTGLAILFLAFVLFLGTDHLGARLADIAKAIKGRR